MKDNYTKIITKKKQEIDSYREHVGELEIQVQKVTSQRREIMEQITAEKKEASVIYSRYISAESRIDTQCRQIQSLAVKETEYLDKIRKLERDLTKSQICVRKVESRRERVYISDENGTVSNLQLEADIQRVKQRSRQHKAISQIAQELNDESD